MSRYIDADKYLEKARYEAQAMPKNCGFAEYTEWLIDKTPSIEIVRCKECKHRPIKEDANEADYGFNVIAPNEDERCPCLVEDGWYSWIPKDDFYCGYGEREGE